MRSARSPGLEFMDSTIIGFANAKRARAHRSGVVSAAVALASLAFGGCAIEGNEACGAHQVYKTGGDILEYAVCVCDEAKGYVFDELQGYGCKRCPEGEMPIGGKCAAPAPDGGQELADASSSPSAPTGVGEYCESSDDCADFDAKYCAVQTNACMLDSCATGANTCTADTVCCDFSKLLANFSLCVPAEQLSGGNCPMGGMKVEQ